MRKLNSIKNFITTIVPYIIIMFLGFWKISAFVENLGEELYSVNQVFLQLFTYLSLAEAGIGMIVNQKYYKLFVEDKKEEIKRVYTASKIFLKRVTYFMLVIGLILSFALKKLTNNDFSLQYLQIVFVLFLLKNLVDYYMGYPRNVMQADQKSYKINNLINAIRILETAIEIVLLYLKVDFILILVPGIFIRIIINYLINKRVFKEYPWLEETQNPDKSIFQGAKYFLTYRISNIIHNNIDILLISAYLDPIDVVIYSSYNYIVKFVSDILGIITQSLVPSLGNAVNELKIIESKKIVEELNSGYSFLAIFTTATVGILVNKFIIIWIGENKQIGYIALAMFLLLSFNLVYQKNIISIVEIKGWFKQTRNIAIFESIINLILSIVFIKIWGIVGVLLATVLASICTSFWYYPIYVYKNVFSQKPIKYYIFYIVDLIFTILITVIGVYIIKTFNFNNYISWGIAAITVSICIMILTLLERFSISKDFRILVKKMLLVFKERRIKNENFGDNANI